MFHSLNDIGSVTSEGFAGEGRPANCVTLDQLFARDDRVQCALTFVLSSSFTTTRVPDFEPLDRIPHALLGLCLCETL